MSYETESDDVLSNHSRACIECQSETNEIPTCGQIAYGCSACDVTVIDDKTIYIVSGGVSESVMKSYSLSDR